MNILFVDDEKMIVDLISDEVGIEISEAKIFKAYNGLEALEICSNEKIDYIFTDIKMPKLDGFGLAQQVQEKYPDTTVFAISGHIGDFQEDELKSKGISKLFEKPINYDLLLEFIKSLK